MDPLTTVLEMLAALQVPDAQKLTAFDALGPIGVAAAFIIAISTAFVTGQIVWGKQHAQLQTQLDEAKAERDAARAEIKQGDGEIREIQDDYRRVIDDYKRLFDQLLYMVAGDAMRSRQSGHEDDR